MESMGTDYCKEAQRMMTNKLEVDGKMSKEAFF